MADNMNNFKTPPARRIRPCTKLSRSIALMVATAILMSLALGSIQALRRLNNRFLGLEIAFAFGTILLAGASALALVWWPPKLRSLRTAFGAVACVPVSCSLFTVGLLLGVGVCQAIGAKESFIDSHKVTFALVFMVPWVIAFWFFLVMGEQTET